MHLLLFPGIPVLHDAEVILPSCFDPNVLIAVDAQQARFVIGVIAWSIRLDVRLEIFY